MLNVYCRVSALRTPKKEYSTRSSPHSKAISPALRCPTCNIPPILEHHHNMPRYTTQLHTVRATQVGHRTSRTYRSRGPHTLYRNYKDQILHRQRHVGVGTLNSWLNNKGLCPLPSNPRKCMVPINHLLRQATRCMAPP